MFTGIINHLGFFKGFRQGKQVLVIEAPSLVSRTEVGDSLAINGICLSLILKEKNLLSFNLSRETLALTNIGSLRPGDRLNLELPLTLQTPLGGHMVTGHIDSKGKVLKVIPRGPGARLVISFPTKLRPYFIPKGSVAVNGASLTIAGLGPSSFEVELIPITLKNSNLGTLRSGDEINLECDIIGKYVYNWMNKKK
jgi:riboflavin synthase